MYPDHDTHKHECPAQETSRTCVRTVPEEDQRSWWTSGVVRRGPDETVAEEWREKAGTGESREGQEGDDT